MKKKKKVTSTRKIPLYVGNLIIVLVDELASLSEEYPNIKKEVFEENGAVTMWHELEVICAFERKRITPGLIAHEANHAKNRVFIWINHECDRFNDEPESYLLSWIVNRIHEIVDKEK